MNCRYDRAAAKEILGTNNVNEIMSQIATGWKAMDEQSNSLEDQAIRFMAILQMVYKAASPRMRDSIQDVQARQIRERVNEIFNQD